MYNVFKGQALEDIELKQTATLDPDQLRSKHGANFVLNWIKKTYIESVTEADNLYGNHKVALKPAEDDELVYIELSAAAAAALPLVKTNESLVDRETGRILAVSTVLSPYQLRFTSGWEDEVKQPNQEYLEGKNQIAWDRLRRSPLCGTMEQVPESEDQVPESEVPTSEGEVPNRET